MSWKDLSYTKKGMIIGGAIILVAFFLGLILGLWIQKELVIYPSFNILFFPAFLILFIPLYNSSSPVTIIFSLIVSLIIYVLIGALIGWIVGKVKKR